MLKQNLAIIEMQAALRIGQLSPASTSPLAGLSPAAEIEPQIIQSLRTKGLSNGSMLTPGWQGILATLADPQQQATAYIEGAGTARYFGGVGGVATMIPLADGQQRVLGGMTRETALAELNDLLGWRSIPDGPPLRVDLTIEELTTVAAIADAMREEQLRAVIERRAPTSGQVARADLDRQVVAGIDKPDRHWLISLLKGFAPSPCAPAAAALNAGTQALAARRWVKVTAGTLQLGAELETLCIVFSNLTPFLVLAIGAPWQEPEITLFIRGLQAFWCIEFRESGLNLRAGIARLGARAMDEALGKRFSPLWSSVRAPVPASAPAFVPVAPRQTAPPQVVPTVAVPRPTRPAPVAATRPSEYAPRPAPAASAAAPTTGVSARTSGGCARCGAPLEPGTRFCVGCGTPVAPGAPVASPMASPAAAVVAPPPRAAVCPNPKCGKPIAPGVKFCTSCGARLK